MRFCKRHKGLLIVGAGIYSSVVKEIAESMRCFKKIDFVDDGRMETPSGDRVIGTCADIGDLAGQYGNVIVAIGNPQIRLSLIEKIEKLPCEIATIVSPWAYVSGSAKVMRGSIIEPMAVVHAGCIISCGCIISAGAVMNHASTCCEGVHVDCNAVVCGGATVPAQTKVESGTVFK